MIIKFQNVQPRSIEDSFWLNISISLKKEISFFKERNLCDIVEILSKNDWEIVSVDENQNRSQGINTTTDLLHLTAQTYISNNDYFEFQDLMLQTYGLEVSEQTHFENFHAAVDYHFGPLYFFSWWEKTWSSKQ